MTWGKLLLFVFYAPEPISVSVSLTEVGTRPVAGLRDLVMEAKGRGDFDHASHISFQYVVAPQLTTASPCAIKPCASPVRIPVGQRCGIYPQRSYLGIRS